MIDAANYGKALFALAQEQAIDAQLRLELLEVKALLQENPAYYTLLDTPAVATAQRLALLRESFGSCNALLLHTLCLLCEKRMVYVFPACADAYCDCYDEAHEIVRATAITAAQMSQAQREALQKKLEELTGKTVEVEARIDESLLGGIRLRYGGIQLDDSVRGRLDRLRDNLCRVKLVET
ncbi:MAG: ATP synthase F1 subunit delta [Oscillospiraceae bacterium]|jgi:F-type H+-transporting ATPase subunit delta|nr:ATP synthase F1 subunit delta [Oscillospiraceae bacterium]